MATLNDTLDQIDLDMRKDFQSEVEAYRLAYILLENYYEESEVSRAGIVLLFAKQRTSLRETMDRCLKSIDWKGYTYAKDRFDLLDRAEDIAQDALFAAS
jgi:hypothetical protein